MGVAGSGKTVMGRALAAELGWRFADADDYHSPANLAKMHRGVPLSDADRAPWLAALHQVIARALERREHLVLACSALRESYRESLRDGLRSIRLVHLTAGEAELRRRLQTRPEHVVGPSLLASQLATLEPPRGALTIDATWPPERILGTIRKEFGI